jgi:hypothetical protein
MLIETIKRYDPSNKLIKYVSVDTLRMQGKSIPPQIHSVPAIVTIDESKGKQILYGKAVFDYLLLPGSGQLLRQTQTQQSAEAPVSGSPEVSAEPSSFAFASFGGLSDKFADYSESNDDISAGFGDRQYGWSLFGSEPESTNNGMAAPLQEETRTKKGTLDLDSYRIQRDMELQQNDLNTKPLPPPSAAR